MRLLSCGSCSRRRCGPGPSGSSTPGLTPGLTGLSSRCWRKRSVSPWLPLPARVLSVFSSKLNILIEAEKLGIPSLAISLTPSPLRSRNRADAWQHPVSDRAQIRARARRQWDLRIGGRRGRARQASALAGAIATRSGRSHGFSRALRGGGKGGEPAFRADRPRSAGVFPGDQRLLANPYPQTRSVLPLDHVR